MKRLKEWYHKLIPLRSVDTTPRIVLERTLDKAARIKAVMVVIHWDDESFDLDWSLMKVSDLAMMATILTEQAQSRVTKGESADYRA